MGSWIGMNARCLRQHRIYGPPTRHSTEVCDRDHLNRLSEISQSSSSIDRIYLKIVAIQRLFPLIVQIGSGISINRREPHLRFWIERFCPWRPSLSEEGRVRQKKLVVKRERIRTKLYLSHLNLQISRNQHENVTGVSVVIKVEGYFD
jgi:hypothetical protein